jgi:zona occludens toxin (predicted ATPase)
LGPQGPVATAKAGCVVAKRRATNILRQAFPWSFVLPLIPVTFSVAFYLLAPSKVANKSREALVQQNTTAVERSAALDQTVANALQNAVNVPGSIRANSVGVRGGKIVLHDGDSDHRRE